MTDMYINPQSGSNGKADARFSASGVHDISSMRIQDSYSKAAVPVILRSVDSLEYQISALEERIAKMEAVVQELGLVAEEVRIIPDDEVIGEIKAYFEARHGQDIYPDQVARDLRLDLLQVVRICEDLFKEGRLA